MKDYIVGIGAANADLNGRSFSPVVLKDSNPGKMTVSVGGVTRNVLENYARLSGRACFLGVVGNDAYGQMIKDRCLDAGIDISRVLTAHDHSTSLYVSVCDDTGNMVVAVSDMNIMQELNVEYLRDNDKIIREARLAVCDPSIPEEVMDYLLDSYDVPVCVDPVSIGYARKIKDKIGRYDTVKPNLLELGFLSDMEIRNDEDVIAASKKLISLGTGRVITTMGRDGSMYVDREGRCLRHRISPLECISNATGAGDSYFAAFLYCLMNGYDLETTMEFASVVSRLKIMSPETVNRNLNIETVREILKEKNYVI